MTLRVCGVTGSRADWGLISIVLERLRADSRFEVQLAATGEHFAEGARGTAHQIERDGFAIDARVEIPLAEDDAVAVGKALGAATAGFAEALHRLKPDVAVVLGDRYEILAAVEAALIARIPVAHLCGGDVTEGAMDDAIRHAITKMSHLHFVTNDESGRRVRQLGEDPARVHVVGSPGIDRIRKTKLLDKQTLLATLGLESYERNLLVTFHPVTLAEDSAAQCRAMLNALERLGRRVGLIFTGSNADPGNREIMRAVERFVAGKPNAALRAHLGAELYYSAMAHVNAVVGNSSSGLYEAPSFKVPTVNIGERQKGRIRAASVIDAAPEAGAIGDALERAFRMDCSSVVNPYGDGHAADRIADVLSRIGDPRALIRKRFFTA